MARFSKDGIVKFFFVLAILFLLKKGYELHGIASQSHEEHMLEQERDGRSQAGRSQAGVEQVVVQERVVHNITMRVVKLNISNALSQSDVGDLDGVSVNIFKHTQTCSDVHRPSRIQYAETGPVWQKQKSASDVIYSYAGFYDDRPATGRVPVVRLHVISTYTNNASLTCQLWFEGITNPYITAVHITKTGRGDKFKGVKYGQWLYTCDLPAALPIPSHISLAPTPCTHTTTLVPVLTPIRSPWDVEFGVCVAIAFGEIPVEQFIEWIEFHKLFGVKEFNIYNGTMSHSMKHVFDYYTSKGIVRVHYMPPPVTEYSKAGAKLSSPASLNDCMLRNMYRYRYMIVLDFDEFIIPKHASNYHKLIKEINKDHQLDKDAKSYSFRNVYYYLDFEADASKPAYLRTIQYRRHAPANGFLYAAKSFIDPLNCLSVFNHYCYVQFPPTQKPFTIDVNSKHATSQHYRKCNVKCEQKDKNTQVDNEMLKYEDELDRRVSSVLRLLNIV